MVFSRPAINWMTRIHLEQILAMKKKAPRHYYLKVLLDFSRYFERIKLFLKNLSGYVVNFIRTATRPLKNPVSANLNGIICIIVYENTIYVILGSFILPPVAPFTDNQLLSITSMFPNNTHAKACVSS